MSQSPLSLVGEPNSVCSQSADSHEGVVFPQEKFHCISMVKSCLMCHCTLIQKSVILPFPASLTLACFGLSTQGIEKDCKCLNLIWVISIFLIWIKLNSVVVSGFCFLLCYGQLALDVKKGIGKPKVSTSSPQGLCSRPSGRREQLTKNIFVQI